MEEIMDLSEDRLLNELMNDLETLFVLEVQRKKLLKEMTKIFLLLLFSLLFPLLSYSFLLAR